MKEKIKKFFLELLFPRFCFGCQKQGCYLCKDCEGILDVSGFHKKFKTKHINDLYFVTEYKNPLLKNLIQKFKSEPFIKELSLPLCSLITAHFQLLDKKPDFSDFVLIPVPLEKTRLKWRGFNQAEEIAKQLSRFFKIPLINDVLIKERKTLPQVKVSEKERKENILKAFCWQNKEKIRNKKVLLIDDIYITGSTMEECATTLKDSGVKEIIGIVIARAKSGQDSFRNV